MRPRHLISVRAKRGRRLSSHGIRIVDRSSLVLVTILMCEVASPATLLDTSVGDVGPFVVAALVFGRALHSLGLYRFVRSEGLVRHLIQLSVAWIVAVTGLLVTRELFDGEPRISTCWQWCGLAAATIAGLHIVWWLTVRSWRADGWLTPNVVIVGATTQAESVISEAVARGHMNVVGVFDDRVGRTPERRARGAGPRRHRRAARPPDNALRRPVVIAVEPGAAERVREIAARLAVLPNEVTLFIDQDDSTAGRPRWPASKTRRWPISTAVPTSTAGRSPSACRTCVIGAPVLILAAR